MNEFYKLLPDAPLDPIIQATAQWAELKQTHDDPINTTVGVLLNPQTGKPWRPVSVQESLTEARDLIDNQDSYGYQTQAGNEQFLSAFGGTVFGEELYNTLYDDKNLISTQTLGGTGSLNLTKDILADLVVTPPRRSRPRLIVDQGWPNHQSIFGREFLFGPADRNFDVQHNHEAFIDRIDLAPEGSICLLQACGYNDDGLDRTTSQWNEIYSSMTEKNMIAIIDAAYLGLAESLEPDRQAIELAMQHNLFAFVCVSTSKNMGLYNERLGALFIANARAKLGDEQAVRLKQISARIVRRTYSNPPLLAAQAVGILLRSEQKVGEYVGELAGAHDKLKSNRVGLAAKLGPEFRHVGIGKGLFTKLFQEGFSSAQLVQLKSEGILALPSSRINLGGIKPEHIERLGTTILQVIDQG